MSEEEMDKLRDKLKETEALARELFEQQFIRCGGRMPADPEWDDLEQDERDDWWDRALDARPLIERERSSRQAWATEALRLTEVLHAVADDLGEAGHEHLAVSAAFALAHPELEFDYDETPLCACPPADKAAEQAEALRAAGPLWSLPQCAVHPEGTRRAKATSHADDSVPDLYGGEEPEVWVDSPTEVHGDTTGGEA